MARFTVRVMLKNISEDPLHRNESEIYSVLHQSMENEGFVKEIESTTGDMYKLPDGEYNLIGDYTEKKVLEMAKRAVNKTQLGYAILLTPTTGRKWVGLEKVVK